MRELIHQKVEEKEGLSRRPLYNVVGHYDHQIKTNANEQLTINLIVKLFHFFLLQFFHILLERCLFSSSSILSSFEDYLLKSLTFC